MSCKAVWDKATAEPARSLEVWCTHSRPDEEILMSGDPHVAFCERRGARLPRRLTSNNILDCIFTRILDERDG
jgi:hypothetical protein